MSPRWIRFPLQLSLAGLLGLAQAAPLTFNSALEQAVNTSPTLVAQRAQIGATQSAAMPAGALPDPKLFVGIDNYPITGPMRGSLTQDFMTMQKVGVMQEIPNADKRRARVEVAAAEIEVAEAQNRMVRLKVRREVALAWLNRYALERKLTLFDALGRESQLLATAVRAQIASGRAQPADAVMPKQEAAQLADRHDDLTRDLAKAKAELRRLIGPAADEPLAGEPPAFNLDAGSLRLHLSQHPEIAAFGAAAHKAEAEVSEAVAMKKPDWGVELAYQKRGAQFGDMVSLQFTFDLPLFTRTRQDPNIAARQQESAATRSCQRIGQQRGGLRRTRSPAGSGPSRMAAVGAAKGRPGHRQLPSGQGRVDGGTGGAARVDRTALQAHRAGLPARQ